MEFDRSAFQRRRQEKIRQIIEQQKRAQLQSNTTEEPSSLQIKEVNSLENNNLEKPPFLRLRLRHFQWLLSFALIITVLLLQQSESDWAKKANEFTRNALTKDFPFEKAIAWIEGAFGQFPSLIPTVQFFESEAIPVFSPPLSGVITETFSPSFTGVIIETKAHEEVHPIAPGLVRVVENRLGMGNVVVIQHGDGMESTYGFLGTVFVQKNDWVYPEQVIAQVKEQSLLLQIRDNQAYVDPLEVISFD